MHRDATISMTLDTDEIEHVAHCVEAIGDPAFPGAICDFALRVSRAETVLLTAFFSGQKPAALHSNHTDESDKSALRLYLDVAYLLDPFYRLFRDAGEDGVVRLKDVAPDDFARSEYNRQFYKAIRLQDECGLMLHISDDAALFFSLGVRTARRRIDAARLNAALPIIAALSRRHWTGLSAQRPDGSGRLAAHLEAAFDAFGSSVLSPREAEIVRMILKGHSSKSIARALDNSPETIKVHRKRVYAKLGVVSQGELLSLFLSALAQMPAHAAGDPLAFVDVPRRGD